MEAEISKKKINAFNAIKDRTDNDSLKKSIASKIDSLNDNKDILK